MKKAEIKILLVEDEVSAGKSLAEIIKRAGFSCLWAKTPSEALNFLKLQTMHLAIVDCLLPQTNGVDLVTQLRKLQGESFPVLMMSGIFKDPQFAEDVIIKTNAVQFFHKPIVAMNLIRCLDDYFGDQIEAALPPQEAGSLKERLTPEETLNTLSQTGSLHGFQLPQLIAMVLSSELSGHLNLIERSGELSSLTFHKGQIAGVNKRHSKSFFGVLVVERGLATEAEINEVLNMTSPKPIGERLVEKGILSPHMIKIIRTEQMRLRLAQTIDDTSYDINFLEEETPVPDISIDYNDFTQMFFDWCWSKIKINWLNAYFLPLGTYELQIRNAQEFQKLVANFHFPFQLTPGNSITQFFNNHPDQTESVIRALYFLLVLKRLFLKLPAKPNVNFDLEITRLDRLYSELVDADPFAVLGVGKNARSKDINKSYLDMAKILHPDKVPPEAPQQLKDLSQKIFALINKSHEQIKDETRRSEYLRSQEIGNARDAFVVENELTQVRQLLNKNRIKEAHEILSALPDSKTHETEIRLFRCWVQVKRKISPDHEIEMAQKLREELNYIPPEDRHTALYFFVRASIYRLGRNLERAHVNFQRCLSLDSQFSEAAVELGAIEAQMTEASRFKFFDTVVSKLIGTKKKAV